MKNLFRASAAEEIERRIADLKPDSHPLWGTMNVAQMVATARLAWSWLQGTGAPPEP